LCLCHEHDTVAIGTSSSIGPARTGTPCTDESPTTGQSASTTSRKAGLTGDIPYVTRNPPVTFFMDLPFGFVSARTGMVLWLVLLLASLMASVRMLWILNGRPDDRLHLLSYVFAPVLACVMAGQVGILLLLGVVLFLFFRIPCLSGRCRTAAVFDQAAPVRALRHRPAGLEF